MLPRIARLRRSIRGYGQSWDGEIYNLENGKSYCGLVILVNPDLLRSRAACYSFAPGRIDSLALKSGSRGPDEARRHGRWQLKSPSGNWPNVRTVSRLPMFRKQP
jgi:hypothetical protein